MEINLNDYVIEISDYNKITITSGKTGKREQASFMRLQKLKLDSASKFENLVSFFFTGDFEKERLDIMETGDGLSLDLYSPDDSLLASVWFFHTDFEEDF